MQGKDIPPYAVVYRIHGPFLFGATDKFSDILSELESLPSVVILRLRNMTAIDATGIGAIEDLAAFAKCVSRDERLAELPHNGRNPQQATPPAAHRPGHERIGESAPASALLVSDERF